jgi:hypothetical protein
LLAPLGVIYLFCFHLVVVLVRHVTVLHESRHLMPVHLVMLCSFHPWDNITTTPDFNMFCFRDTPGFRHVAHLMISTSFLQCQLKLSIVVVKIIVIPVYVFEFDQFLFPDPNFLGFQGKKYYFSALLCSDLF